MDKMIETGAAAGAGAAAAAQAGAAAKGAALATGVGIAVGGGVLMILLDPPKTRRQMFLQALVAGVVSIVGGPLALHMADKYLDIVDLANADFTTILELAAPVYFLLGTLSWGIASAVVRLREIIGQRGADAIAGRVMPPKDGEK